MELIVTIIGWLLKPVRWGVGLVMSWAGKEQQGDIEKRIQKLEREVQRLRDDPGYEIINYWDEDGAPASREMIMAFRGAGVYLHPRTIFSSITGTIQEIRFPGDKKKKGGK